MSERSTASTGSSDELALTDQHVRREVVSTIERFHGRVWDIRTDVVDLGDGQRVERDVVRHPGAVGIIAVDDELRVLMVRQYRHPVAAMLWEPPAGLLDVPGEAPLDAAARELFEETGHRAAQWSVLVDAFTSPGGSSEAVRIYLARGLSEVAADERHVGDGEERDMPTRWVPLDVARAAVLAGELHSPLCVMGILAAAGFLLDAVAAPGITFPRPPESVWLRSGGRSR
jgi:8-oxo-dGTP pyrophosphatase MutT (NUDIX family)